MKSFNCAEADLFGHVHLDVAKSIVRTDDPDADYVFRTCIFYSLLSRACVIFTSDSEYALTCTRVPFTLISWYAESLSFALA